MKFSVFAMFAMMAVGCAAPLATKSGRPEITISESSREAVESRVMNFFVDKGFQPTVVDKFTLRFDKAGDFGESMFYGTPLQPTAFERIVVTILEPLPSQFRITGKFALVRNRGSANEAEVPLEGEYDQRVQKMLEELRSSIGVAS